MNKIKVILSGGLGNQLFQLFTALKYAESMRISKIEIGVGFFNTKNEVRKFDLFECVDLNSIRQNFENIDIQITSSIFDKLIFRFTNRLPCLFARALFINNDNVDQSKLSCAYLHVGYKQDISFLPSREKIKNVFRDLGINKRFDIGIHVRRGDYQNPKFSNYGLVDLLSIKKIIVNQIGSRNKKIVVFSDSDVKNEFRSTFSEFVDLDVSFAADLNLSASHEFLLMRSCPYLICSNSTFSWWAAYSSSKNIVAYLPSFWYKGILIPEKFIFPDSVIYDANLT